MQIEKQAITAVILAGGEARRMDRNDKGLITLRSKPMVQHILEKLSPQVGSILINANRNLDDYAGYGYPVITDSLAGFNGPLAGLLSGMEQCKTSYLVSVPCDSPFIPGDLVKRLATALKDEDVDIAVAHNGERMQPVFSLLKTVLIESLRDYLQAGERKIDRWFEQHHFRQVDFSDDPETFININTPEELKQAEQRLAATPS